jgi:uncharacterized protein YjdB
LLATTDAGAALAATVNGQSCTVNSGQITANLKDGYNTVVITSTNATGTTTKVHNIRAKKMAYTIENLTRPGSQDLYEGDIMKVAFTGIVIPVPKVSRIYNPAAVHVTYSCSMPQYSTVWGSASQYGIAESNGIQIELTGAGDFILSNGHVDESWFGSGLYSETPVGKAPPVLDADQPENKFSVLPDIHFTVKENADYNPQLLTANIENTEDIWPGDEVTITIPGLDIDTLAKEHPNCDDPTGWGSYELIDSYTTFSTDIPGLETVKSANVKVLEDLEKLKTIKFIVPENTKPGTYTVKGGYVWVKYGPSWWTKQKNYFTIEIADIPIEVKESTTGEQHGAIDINNETLKNKLALAAGKPEGYTKKLTNRDLEAITGTVDLSNAGITDEDMAVMRYLEGVSAINLSGNTGITSATVNKETFDWTTPKSLDFSGCTGVTEIAAKAFMECTNLTAITLPEATSIGDECFSSCEELTAVTLPDTLTSIGESCFADCTALTEVTLPNALTKIGDYGFSGCTALTEITLPDSMMILGNNVFRNCSSLTSIDLSKKLQSIGDRCFGSCKELKSITLPETLTSLGEYCFSWCYGLEYMKLPKSLQSIGDYCFIASSIDILDLRETNFTSVESNWQVPRSTAVLLGQDAKLSPAQGNINLGEETLTITHAVPQEKALQWASINTDIATVTDGVVSGVQPGTTLIYAKTDDDTYSGFCQVTVTDNGKARLKGLSLSGITLNEALDPAKYIYTAEIAGDVRNTTVTAEAADEGSTINVNDIDVADGTPSESIALKVGANTIQVKVASADGKTTKSYTINITMKAVTIGEDYVVIGNAALQERLAAAVGKESGYTGKLTFDELATITGTIDLSNAEITDADMAVMKYLTGVSAINLSGNTAITSVRKDAFDWRTPKGLDFSGCTGVTSVGSTFEKCANLTELILPDTVTRVWGYSFQRCSKLAHISIPGVTSIDRSAFQNCTALKEVDFSDNITSFGPYCFRCTGFKEIRVPSGITELPNGCFDSCEDLTYVSVPRTVTDIGRYCFSDCEGLSVLDLRETNITAVDSDWELPSSTVVLFPGIDAELPETVTLKLGEETATITHSIPQDKTVVWGSTNTDVAVVSNKGVVTGMQSGTAVIYAKTEDNRYSGICRVNVVATDNARLQELSLSDITLNEAFDPAVVFYTADTGCHIKNTTVTAKTEDGESTLKINGKVVADGCVSEPINLAYGNNTIIVQVTTKDGTVTKTYTINLTKKNIYEGDNFIAIANQSFKNKLAAAAGKEKGYEGNLTYDELASITGDFDLSNTVLTDEDMVVMKYLTGVSSINLTGNTAITSDVVKRDTFDWTVLKSLDFTGCTGITEIKEEAFKGSSELTGITLPNTVITLGKESFSGCKGITSIKLPGSINNVGSEVFYECTSLTEADFSTMSPETVFDRDVFYGCTGITDMTKIKLPEGMTTLPYGFFQYCSGITKIELPESITSLENYVFNGCTGITEVDLTGIKTLGENVFGRCSNLKKVKIPEGITTLPSAFFGDCIGLTMIVN